MKNIRQNFILISLIVSAFAVRIYSVFANLPYMYWHDENNYIDNALYFGKGSFKLITYTHGALYQVVLFLEYSAYYAVGKILGWFRTSLDFYIGYLKDPTPFFLMARVTTVLCGTASVYLTYLIAKKIYGRSVGLAAGLFAGFALIMVQMSSLALADVPSVFILLLSFLAIVACVEKPDDDRAYYIAAMLVGLAFACKYHTMFGAVPLYIAAYIKCRDSKKWIGRFSSLAIFGSFFIFAGFCIGMPFFLANFTEFKAALLYDTENYIVLKSPSVNTWLFYFTNHLRNGLGIPLLIASMGGIYYAVWKRSKWDILLISVPIAHYLVFMHSTGFAYHLLPAIPFILILAARLLDVISRRVFSEFAPAAFICLSVIVALPTSADSVKFMKMISSPDTRNMAKCWIDKNIPSGAKIMEEGYVDTVATHGPALVGNMSTLKRDLEHVVSKGGNGFTVKTKMADFKRLYGDGRSYDLYKKYWITVDDIEHTDASYIITTGDNDNPTGPELDYYMTIMMKDYYGQRRRMKEAVSSKYALIKSFLPSYEMTAWVPHMSDLDYIVLRAAKWDSIRHYVKGPSIYIYKLREQAAP